MPGLTTKPKFAFRIEVAAIVLAIILSLGQTAPVVGQEIVSFSTPDVQPSAFRVRRAQAQGVELTATPGIPLTGLLSIPEKEGPHPAIILLPESIEARSSYIAWSESLNANGFATLLVHSLEAREQEVLRDDLPMNLREDAKGAYAFLTAMPEIDDRYVGLMGFGLSGNFVQRALDAEVVADERVAPFFAGIALYPHCNAKLKLASPILVLAGDLDMRMSVAACENLIASNIEDQPQSMVHIYQGATHYFDNRSYLKDQDKLPENWIEPAYYQQNHFSAEAKRDAEQDVIEFLEAVKLER